MPILASQCRFLFSMALPVSVAAYAQSPADLKSDLALVNRCAHAAQVVVKSVELYPLSKQGRDKFTQTVVQKLRETNQLGAETPSDVNLFFASVDDLLGKDINLKDPASREWLSSQSAAACALFSSRAPAERPP